MSHRRWPRPLGDWRRIASRKCDSLPFEQALERELVDGRVAPDLTRSIMGRLGYMRVSRRAAMRHRIRCWMSRLGTISVVALALGIGFHFYATGQQVRRPQGLTIPDAVSNDVERGSNQIQNAIQTIRNLGPRRATTPDGGAGTHGPASQPPAEPLHDGVNQLPSTPTRWV